mmetsp:Transcript_4578/g.10017  ORF Transcript_4578/g.10017 Transcript_4578/m.10017 type:complete len:330 (-) Transcript_4578:363-1352(-)
MVQLAGNPHHPQANPSGLRHNRRRVDHQADDIHDQQHREDDTEDIGRENNSPRAAEHRGVPHCGRVEGYLSRHDHIPDQQKEPPEAGDQEGGHQNKQNHRPLRAAHRIPQHPRATGDRHLTHNHLLEVGELLQEREGPGLIILRLGSQPLLLRGHETIHSGDADLCLNLQDQSNKNHESQDRTHGKSPVPQGRDIAGQPCKGVSDNGPQEEGQQGHRNEQVHQVAPTEAVQVQRREGAGHEHGERRHGSHLRRSVLVKNEELLGVIDVGNAEDILVHPCACVAQEVPGTGLGSEETVLESLLHSLVPLNQGDQLLGRELRGRPSDDLPL